MGTSVAIKDKHGILGWGKLFFFFYTKSIKIKKDLKSVCTNTEYTVSFG